MADIVLTKTGETSSTISFRWDAVPGADGYRFSREKSPAGKYSHTWDGERTTVTFSKDSSWYEVEALNVNAAGKWPTAPPPPVGDKLAWKPPGYTGGDPKDPKNYPGFQVVHMSESNRVFTGSGDLFVICDSKVTHPYFKGFRHIVAIGVEVDQTSPNENGSDVHGCTGVIHFEGWWVHGSGLRDGLGLSTGGTATEAGATIQLQNYRTGPVHTSGDYHGDNVQLWGSSGSYRGGCGLFRVDRFTAETDLQAIFLGNHDGALLDSDIRNTNLVGKGPRGGAQLLYKHARKDLYGQSSVMTLTNVWMKQIATGGTVWTTPDNWVVPNASGTDWGNTPIPDRAAKIGQDKDGQFVYWVPTADVKGQVRVGDPPGGDFVPAGKAGLGYVSPGYV